MVANIEQSLRAVIGDILSRHLPDVAVRYERRRGRRNMELLIVEIALEHAAIRIGVPIDQRLNQDGGYLADLLEARIDEARAQQANLGARIAALRSAIQVAMDRGSTGMQLVALAMAPALISAKLRWSSIPVRADVVMLDENLRPETVEILGRCQSDFEADLRCNAPIQRRRWQRQDVLARYDAVAEIDSIAEGLIRFHGHCVQGIVARLLDGEPAVHLSGIRTRHGDNRVSLHMTNRRIIAVGFPVLGDPAAFLNGPQLRVGGLRSPGQCAELVGKPPTHLIAIPGLPAEVRIAQASARDRYTDLTLQTARRYITFSEMTESALPVSA
jgi:hypothetical protein